MSAVWLRLGLTRSPVSRPVERVEATDVPPAVTPAESARARALAFRPERLLSAIDGGDRS